MLAGAADITSVAQIVECLSAERRGRPDRRSLEWLPNRFRGARLTAVAVVTVCGSVARRRWWVRGEDLPSSLPLCAGLYLKWMCPYLTHSAYSSLRYRIPTYTTRQYGTPRCYRAARCSQGRRGRSGARPAEDSPATGKGNQSHRPESPLSWPGEQQITLVVTTGPTKADQEGYAGWQVHAHQLARGARGGGREPRVTGHATL